MLSSAMRLWRNRPVRRGTSVAHRWNRRERERAAKKPSLLAHADPEARHLLRPVRPGEGRPWRVTG